MRSLALTTSLFVLLAAGSALAHEADEWAAAGEPGKAATITRTIAVDAREMRFTPDTLEIRKGETIKFVVTNTGRKSHEFVLGDEALQIAHMKMMAAMPDMKMDDPNELELKPGETKSLIWHFTRPGKFIFACDFPGHADAGMEGDITVR